MSNKVLLVRFSSLGDIVLTTPVAEYLAESAPSCEIYFLTKKKYADLIKFFPVSIKPIFLEDYGSLWSLAKEIKKHRFYKIYDLHHNLRTNILKIFLWGKIKSYRKNHAYRKRKIRNHDKKLDIHAVKSYFSGISVDNVEDDRFTPTFQIKKPEPRGVSLGIHPGASRATKQWPVGHLIELVNIIKKETLWKISFFGGPTEKTILNVLKEEFPKDEFFGPDISLNSLIEEMNGQSFFLVNDSGPMHIAEALNKPLLCLFGATHPSLGFYPTGKKSRWITKNLDCSPCSLHGDSQCPRNHFNCMLKITPQEVFDHLKKIQSLT